MKKYILLMSVLFLYVISWSSFAPVLYREGAKMFESESPYAEYKIREALA